MSLPDACPPSCHPIRQNTLIPGIIDYTNPRRRLSLWVCPFPSPALVNLSTNSSATPAGQFEAPSLRVSS